MTDQESQLIILRTACQVITDCKKHIPEDMRELYVQAAEYLSETVDDMQKVYDEYVKPGVYFSEGDAEDLN